MAPTKLDLIRDPAPNFQVQWMEHVGRPLIGSVFDFYRLRRISTSPSINSNSSGEVVIRDRPSLSSKEISA